MKCHNCGRSASGKFCSNCGASLESTACPTCGHTPPAGARFCNQCGGTISAAATTGPTAPAAARPAPAAARTAPAAKVENNTLWVVGGVIVVGAMLVVLYPIFSPQSKNLGPPQQPVQGSASAIDLTTMTPRQAADRLWTRVMTAAETGNTQEVINFLPMAIAAYEVAEPLDLDGKYHLSALKREAQDFDGALETAVAALETYPDHLLLLAAAAEASLALGDSVTARSRYQQMLDVWDTELATGRTDYEIHANMQPVLRRSAEAVLGG